MRNSRSLDYAHVSKVFAAESATVLAERTIPA